MHIDSQWLMHRDRTTITWLDEHTPLPSAESALGPDSELEGLVAAGGGLSVARLLEAYRLGIYPWYSESQPVLWWSPDPRMVLKTEDFKLRRSLRKTLQKFVHSPGAKIQFDSNFSSVIRHCAMVARPTQSGTWIVDEMVEAYEALHKTGHAHSVETWVNDQLVGGLYCVSMGRCIFGESMFSLESNASQIALAALVAFARAQGASWIDCQQNTRHMASLGAHPIPRSQLLKAIETDVNFPNMRWEFKPTYWSEVLPAREEN